MIADGIKWGGLGGALVVVLAWANDVRTAASLGFAGASDELATHRLLGVSSPALFEVEVEVLAFACACAVAVGALAGAGRGGPATRTRLRGLFAGAAAVAVVLTLAVAGMMARYPQLYADRWWVGGGAPAAVMRLVTHGAGPGLFDVLLVLGVLGLWLRAVRCASRTRSRLVLMLSPLAVAVASWACLPRPPPAAPDCRTTGPNVLVVAADSMRPDRLESAHMPFLKGKVGEGEYFSAVFTPIARTFPSWVSMLTGLEPRATSVRTMFPSTAERENVGATLFTQLRDEGYRTFVVSDFAGDVFPRFAGGFELVDAPDLDADALVASSALVSHGWFVPLLRLPVVRWLFPVWRNSPNLADPEWVVDGVLGQLDAAGACRFAGLVFFSTAHFPYVAPHPYYLGGDDEYQGPYLYHVPPSAAGLEMSSADVVEVRARYDGSLAAVDRAIERLFVGLEARGLASQTVVAVTSDHGEALYEESGIGGHGDRVDDVAQQVPLLIVGPGTRAGVRDPRQARTIDLPATLLDLTGTGDGVFGHGLSLRRDGPRPLCVESGIWFWPTLPAGLAGRRLEYESIASLLDMEPDTRELVLRADRRDVVEASKQRGLVLGHRLYWERPSPDGRWVETSTLAGIPVEHGRADLAALFEERCVRGDPRLERRLGAIVPRRLEEATR